MSTPRDEGLDDQQLDTSDGVLTGCALAIAQTGTIVLDAGAAQGRRGCGAALEGGVLVPGHAQKRDAGHAESLAEGSLRIES